MHRFRDHIQEAEVISEEIEGLLNNGVDITNICILVKQLPDTYRKELIRELKSRGINARNEGMYIPGFIK